MEEYTKIYWTIKQASINLKEMRTAVNVFSYHKRIKFEILKKII